MPSKSDAEIPSARGSSGRYSAIEMPHIALYADPYIYIRCIYGIFGREIKKYTVIYGVYIQLCPTLYIW